jgi:hypothetical protein
MEEETGVHVYPDSATVTYFTAKGSPTVIFDKEGTIDHTFDFTGTIRAMEFSRPRLLKHVAFPGNLLHAAPSEVMFGDEEEDEVDLVDETDNESSPTAHGNARNDNLAAILAHIPNKRITFLVNIWLNHIPSQSVRCDEILFPQFHTALTPDRFSLSPAAGTVEGINKKVFRLPDADCTRSVVLKFVANDLKYDVIMPLPSTEQMCRILFSEDMAGLVYVGEDRVHVTYSSDQEDSDGEESSDEEEANSLNDSNDREEGITTAVAVDVGVEEQRRKKAKIA